jgi:hypothetical protein
MPPGIGGKTVTLMVGVVVSLTQAKEHVRNRDCTCLTTTESSPATIAKGKGTTRSNATVLAATATGLDISQGTADLLAGTQTWTPGVIKTIASTTGETTSVSRDLTDNETTTNNLTIAVRTIDKMTGSVITISATTATITARIGINSAIMTNVTTYSAVSMTDTELTSTASKVSIRTIGVAKEAKELIMPNPLQMPDRVC